MASTDKNSASTDKNSASTDKNLASTEESDEKLSDQVQEVKPETSTKKKTPKKRPSKQTSDDENDEDFQPSSSVQDEETAEPRGKKKKTATPAKPDKKGKGKGKTAAKSEKSDSETDKKTSAKTVKKPALTAAKKAELKKMIYQFKISLMDTEVWRRIQIPGKSTFFDLSSAIHKAMGWLGVHMVHHFEVKNPKTDAIERLGSPGAFMGDNPNKNEKNAHIVDYFLEPNDKAFYMYTYGEGWVHEILFEKTIIPAVNATYPKCSGGKLACPPEDCGGVDGYHRIVEIVKNPQHDEYEETQEWLDDQGYRNYDPDKFVPRNAFKVPKPKKVWMWLPKR